MDNDHLPKMAAAREVLAATIGVDSRRLRLAVDA
jgi:hypothetical protein